MKSCAVILLAIVSTNAIEWDTVRKTNEILKGYHAAAEDVIKSVEQIMSNSSAEVLRFLSSLDDIPVVKEVRSIPESECKEKFTDLKQLKNSFKAQSNHLEGPIIKRISDIKSRFNDLWSTLAVYQGLADGKWWACQIDGEDCTNRTQNWLDVQIRSLSCKIVPNCGNRHVKKREATLTLSCERYEYPYRRNGLEQCVDIDSYTCDSSCRRENCKDEPSPNCSKHCVGGYHCTNLQCIDKRKVCDGEDDCGDGSDEKGCPTRDIALENCTLETGMYLCKNKKKCIELSRSCDGNMDCPDGSDEGILCSLTDCGSGCLAAGGVCLSTARGGVCLSHCPPGTHETPQGCRTGPALPPVTLAELLEDTPRLTSRYLAGIKLLQSRVVDELAASLSRVAACVDKPTSFDSILQLSDFKTTHNKQTKTTSKPPHTTTKHRTTSYRPTTYPTTTPHYFTEYDY